MLNIDSHGMLQSTAAKSPTSKSTSRSEAVGSSGSNRREGTDLKPGEELPSIVVIRADQATPFKLLNRLIKACQDNGFRNFALKAMNKEGT